MSYKTIFLLFVLSINLFSCSKSKNTPNIDSDSSMSNQSQRVIQTDSPIILEVTQDAEGMWDVTGKTLIFRLHESGTVEFEYPDDKKKVAGFNKAEDINSLKKVVINDTELQDLERLISTQNVQKLKSNYKRVCCCTDAILNYKINFQLNNQPQSISLVGCCSVDEIVNPKNIILSPMFQMR